MSDPATPSEPPGKLTISEANIVQGATITAAYQQRTMNYYPVSDSELRTLSQDETFIALFGSLATFCAGSWVTIWAGSTFLPSPAGPPPLLGVLGVALLVLVVIFLALTVWCWLQRRTTLNRIRQESTSVDVAATSSSPRSPI